MKLENRQRHGTNRILYEMNISIGLVTDAVSAKGENYPHTKRMERVIYNYNQKGNDFDEKNN